MFPKLLSDHILEPEAASNVVMEPRRNARRLDAGLERFILGLAAKTIVADHLTGLLGQIRIWGPQAVSV